MPIGTTAAILGSAVIGAGTSLLSSKKNSKAIKQSTQAQQQSADQQIAYQQQARAENTAALSPFMARGNAAGDVINAALGLGGGAIVPASSLNPSVPSSAYVGPNGASGALTVPYNGGYPDASSYPGYAALAEYGPGGGRFNFDAMLEPQAYGFGGEYASAVPAQTVGMAPQGQPQGQTPQQAALNAYEIFKQSTGYQTRLNEGFRGLNSNYAARGVLQSGAAVKSALRFGQDYASNEFGNWLGQLGNQQGLGFAGASALAGVSQGAADRLGAISQNSADNASNAAIARAQNQGALWSGIAGAVGTAAGALSSYRQPSFSTGGRSPYVINNYGYA